MQGVFRQNVPRLQNAMLLLGYSDVYSQIQVQNVLTNDFFPPSPWPAPVSI